MLKTILHMDLDLVLGVLTICSELKDKDRLVTCHAELCGLSLGFWELVAWYLGWHLVDVLIWL